MIMVWGCSLNSNARARGEKKRKAVRKIQKLTIALFIIETALYQKMKKIV